MRKIFIIDNLNSVNDFYSDFLSLKGYEIAAASSVKDFTDRLSQFPPDLIIYDTDMPGQESEKFTDLVLTFPGLLSTPILFLTGFINESKIRNFENIGKSSFLSKDSTNSQVLNRIKRLIDNYKNSPESRIPRSTGHIEQSAIN